ncbi:hypothetical protein ACGVWS_03810 [Enterobacteriaceae bacterium LUAb1]
MTKSKLKNKRTKKVKLLIQSSGSQNKPTASVLELCRQYCNGEISDEIFRFEYFKQLADWSEHHWHFRYASWWNHLSDEEQRHLGMKYGTLNDIILALIAEDKLPDLR